MQLLRIDWNVIFTIINLIVLYLALRHFLIGPVTKVMEQRKAMIDGQFADAKKTQLFEILTQYFHNLFTRSGCRSEKGI